MPLRGDDEIDPSMYGANSRGNVDPEHTTFFRQNITTTRVIEPRENKATQGRKFDTGKLRWSLLPTGVLNLVIEVLEIGAQKYDVDNWKFVESAKQRYYDALLRHVDSWWQGEKQDPETGKHHLAHATCCLFFLLWLDTNPKPAR